MERISRTRQGGKKRKGQTGKKNKTKKGQTREIGKKMTRRQRERKQAHDVCKKTK